MQSGSGKLGEKLAHAGSGGLAGQLLPAGSGILGTALQVLHIVCEQLHTFMMQRLTSWTLKLVPELTSVVSCLHSVLSCPSQMGGKTASGVLQAHTAAPSAAAHLAAAAITAAGQQSIWCPSRSMLVEIIRLHGDCCQV